MFDLHTHSNFSDGVLPPEKLLEEAKAAGLSLVALTDHDTADGIPCAIRAAEELSQPFIPGIEIEAEYGDELHILGLGVDPFCPELVKLTSLQTQRRIERNDRMIKLLESDGIVLPSFADRQSGSATKADIAAALVEAGRCSTIGEAFSRYLVRGTPYYVSMERPTIRETLDAIRAAGGVAVHAHPMNMREDPYELIKSMRGMGLWGVEAYYSRADEAKTAYFRDIARELGLRPTCGSDFHGPGRRDAPLGCAWRNVSELAITEGLLKNMYGISRSHPAGSRRGGIRRAARRVTELEFQLLAERITAELPEDFFKGLNGGVVISDRAKLHKRSRPERPLYILGEYHYGGNEGRYITLYYGSFMRAHGDLKGAEFADELRRVILHEFRHHLETRAGQHDLEYEDEDSLDEYSLAADVAEGRGDDDLR